MLEGPRVKTLLVHDLLRLLLGEDLFSEEEEEGATVVVVTGGILWRCCLDEFWRLRSLCLLRDFLFWNQ